jgi:hypothetical protein
VRLHAERGQGLDHGRNREARIATLLAECDRLRVLLAYKTDLIGMDTAMAYLSMGPAAAVRLAQREAVAGHRTATIHATAMPRGAGGAGGGGPVCLDVAGHREAVSGRRPA